MWQERSSFDDIVGTTNLYFYYNNRQHVISPPTRNLELDNLPPLRYEYVRKSHLQDFDVFKADGKIMKCVQVLTHRGCRAGCSFCSEKILCYGQPIHYTAKRPEVIINEIWHYVYRFGVEAVFFDDSTFIEDVSFVKELCKQLRNSGLSKKIKWGCLNRFDKVTDTKLIKDMADSGLTYMYLGLEVYDNDALRRAIKYGGSNISMVEIIDRALDILAENKVNVGVSILFGLPNESEEVEFKTIDFVGKMVDMRKIHLVSLSLLNHHLASALTGSSDRQESFNYLKPPSIITVRKNHTPGNCFEEAGWYPTRTRIIDENYLSRILWHVDNCIQDKSVLVRQKQLHEFITSSWDRKAVEVPEAYSLISSIDKIVMGQHRIVDSYVRYDQELCNYLRDIKNEIVSGFTHGEKCKHFLVCGAPGSGKTSFIEQIARSTGIVYDKLDLAGANKDYFESRLTKLEDDRECKLLIIDEIQAKVTEKWPYELIKASMDATSKKQLQVTFVLIGNMYNITDMRNHIQSRDMGEDIIRRIPNECEIPGMSLGDRLVIATSNLIEALRQQKMREIRYIEKSALFYIILNPKLNSAGEIGDFAHTTVRNIKKGDERIMYDHLFRAGDRSRGRFARDRGENFNQLEGKFIYIED